MAFSSSLGAFIVAPLGRPVRTHVPRTCVTRRARPRTSARMSVHDINSLGDYVSHMVWIASAATIAIYGSKVTEEQRTRQARKEQERILAEEEKTRKWERLVEGESRSLLIGDDRRQPQWLPTIDDFADATELMEKERKEASKKQNGALSSADAYQAKEDMVDFGQAFDRADAERKERQAERARRQDSQ
ncbi:hypothetical protein FVE85_0423 [Porphyridium purpureum]|uniref:Uncharacterized protein n=1 Tax=Porphyridium purpureum TaxID=35688 RepID=A0A5J4Z195_PORPP|nr:hypothetical protein FVE85_0423 [Porphyridium purpureum]|eukprot:POR5900..scf208_2